MVRASEYGRADAGRHGPVDQGQSGVPWRWPLLLYSGLALLWTGPALFSGGEAVCALDSPDSWMHIWAFWRAGFALGGGDLGYVTSHLLTFPGQVFEIISIFDPLLPWLAVPFGLVLGGAAPFNLLTAGGLLLSAMCGYRLTLRLTTLPGLALLGGVVVAFNPLVYRQICGGFVEYAWWGLVPLTLHLYLSATQRGGRSAYLWHGLSFLCLALLSIYCAVFYLFLVLFIFVGHAASALRRRRARPRLGRSLRAQLVALALVTPILGLWLWGLGELQYKGMPWGAPPTADVDGPGHGGPSAYLDERLRNGSLDVADLAGITADSRPFSPETSIYPRRFEAVFGPEWLPVVGLALLGLVVAGSRRWTAVWLAAALFFLVLGLGPRLLYQGQPVTSTPMPYAWLHSYLPGFSRLVVPGRAALIAALVLGLLSVNGAARVFEEKPLIKRFHWLFGAILAGATLGLFGLLGDTTWTLPTTRLPLAPLYRALAARADQGALLELPLEGKLSHRMLGQTVHRRPIYRGLVPEMFVDVVGTEPVNQNPLVRWLSDPAPDPALPDRQAALTAARSLSRLGFGHLVLHAAGFASAEQYRARASEVAVRLGRPWHSDPTQSAWSLPR